MNWNKLFLLFTVLNLPLIVDSQKNTISGIVKDTLNRPVNSATVLLYKIKDTTAHYKFRITDETGVFTFVEQDKELLSDVFVLKILHVNYDDFTQILKVNEPIDAILMSKTNELNQIIIDAEKPLKIKGDTLSYSVAQWKDQKDNSIEDVLKRIPGIELDSKGYISYNGQYINHLYINGIDLLENRYTIASKGLPADVVKDIEVLNKHAHKKVNKSTNKSKGVSINLITKSKNIFTGINKVRLADPLIGIGLESTPIFINPKYQLVSSLKATNLPEDYTLDNRLSIIKDNEPQPDYDFISIFDENNQQLTGIDQKYWRQTVTGNYSIDAITKNEKDRLIKVGYSTDYDHVELEDLFEETIQLQSSIINNSELNKILNISRTHYLKSFIETNKENSYTKLDVFANSFHNDRSVTTILNNNNNFERKSENRGASIYSSMQHDVKHNEFLWSYNGLFQYKNARSFLLLTPAVFSELNSNSNDLVRQNIDSEEAVLKANVGFYREIEKGSIEVKALSSFKNQLLFSSISQLGEVNNNQFPFSNTQNYNQYRFELDGRMTKRYNNLNLTIKSLAYYINIENKDSANSIDAITNLYWEPKVNALYDFNEKWNATTTFSITNDFADINSLQTAFLIRDYNATSLFENRLQRSRSYNYGFSLGYKDLSNNIFFNAQVYHLNTENELTPVFNFDNNGFRNQGFRDLANKNKSLFIDADISKIISRKLNIKLSVSHFINNSELFFNDEFADLQTANYNFSLNVKYDPLGWYYLDSKWGFLNSRSLSENTKLDSYNYTAQLIFGQEISERHFTEFTWNGQQNTFLNNKQFNHLFDFRYIWKIKSQSELNFKIVNLSNQKRFQSINRNSNITSVNSFPLIGRQFVLSYQFFF